MQNWCSDENEAMKGYILYAAKKMNESDKDCHIDEDTLKWLLTFLYRATDDMTADEAQAYYYKSIS